MLELGLVVAAALLAIGWVLFRSSRRYRARCLDCPYLYGSSELSQVRSAAILHNLHSREKGEGHSVIVETRR